MFTNYFKTAWRNLVKNKLFALINIAGLSIGMAACMLILQYVSFEFSYDRFNEHARDLYRVANDRYQNGKLIQHGTITYSAIGKAMQDDYAEVINHTRVMPVGPSIITYQNKKLGEQEGLAVDNSFLFMFSYPLLAGDKQTALKDAYDLIISQSMANKIFGNANPESLIGKAITIGRDSTLCRITGVCEDAPENSHLHFDFLLSYSTVYLGSMQYTQADYDFTQSDFWHYIQLKPGTNYRTLEAKLPGFSKRHFQGNKVSGSDEVFHLQPLLKAHLYSDYEYEIGRTSSSVVVWGLLIIAAFIVIIAWVNYINLATAKSMERAKEVGVRKVAGATREQLVRQFLTESFLINLTALTVALIVVLLVQQPFNNLIQHHLSLSYLFKKDLTGFNISVGLIMGLLLGVVASAFYPAFVLSSFKPILVLKGKLTASHKGIVFRKVLVVGQFAITVGLIIGAFVVYRQIRFVNEQNLGMNISQVLIVKPPELTRFDSDFIPRENSFTNQLKQFPHVQAAASSWNVVGGDIGRSFNVRRTDQDEKVHLTMRHSGIGVGYIDLYKLKLLAGRAFDNADYNFDYNKLHNLVVNESAVKLLGYRSPQDAIGKTIMRGQKEWTIVGVVNDYHQKSLRYPIEPTMFFPAYSSDGPISVRVDTKDLTATIAAIKKSFESFFPGNLFDYYFLDERFNSQYKDDQLFGKVFAIFAGFAIFIACLGLLGLSLFTTTQRTKEIGVRKVLGASVSNIVFLLSKDFIRLVIIAFLVASPLAWFIMQSWLNNFAYRINIGFTVFLVAGLVAVLVALATISFQTIKTAIANPVKSLRTE
jgi:putative ABC transport system permease protein